MDRQLHRGWSVQQRHRRRVISRRASKRRRNRLWTNVSRRSPRTSPGNVMGDVVAIELAIQGTFRGPMETPAGVIQPTGEKVDIPCADFFYMRNGKIERFDCYPALNIMLKEMGVPPDFASAVKRSTDADTV